MASRRGLICISLITSHVERLGTGLFKAGLVFFCVFFCAHIFCLFLIAGLSPVLELREWSTCSRPCVRAFPGQVGLSLNERLVSCPGVWWWVQGALGPLGALCPVAAVPPSSAPRSECEVKGPSPRRLSPGSALCQHRLPSPRGSPAGLRLLGDLEPQRGSLAFLNLSGPTGSAGCCSVLDPVLSPHSHTPLTSPGPGSGQRTAFPVPRVQPRASLRVCLEEIGKELRAGRTSLVAQCLRIRLPMQGTRVRALVREDPTCHGATKPVRHNC